jgi:hypothetical protein
MKKRPVSVVVALLALTTGACSIDSGATWAPDLLKDKAPPGPVAEAPPDIRQMLTTGLSSMFLPSAAPTYISFSSPLRSGQEWTTCVRATVNGATGGSIGQQTFLFNIDRGKVMRQEHVAPTHWCAQMSFQQL